MRILLPCPCCRTGRATINLQLAAFGQDCEFHCLDCNAEFGRSHVKEVLAKWPRVLAWLENAPEMEDRQ